MGGARLLGPKGAQIGPAAKSGDRVKCVLLPDVDPLRLEEVRDRLEA